MGVIEPIYTTAVQSGLLIGCYRVTQFPSTVRPTGHASPEESVRSRGVGDAGVPSQSVWPCAHIEACVSEF